MPLWFLACSAGSVDLDGTEPFGEVGSAAWLVLDAPEADARTHVLDLHTSSGFCSAYAEGSALVSELVADDVEGCPNDRWAEIGEAFGDIYDEGMTELALTLPGEPEAQTYSIADADGEDVGPEFTGTLKRYHGNPWTHLAENYDCDDPDGSASWLVEEGVFHESWTVTAGHVEVTAVGSDSAEAEGEGDLHANDADPDAAATASFEASGNFRRCEATELEGALRGW